MAVYYLDEYIEATKLMVKEAKMKWINGVDWDDVSKEEQIQRYWDERDDDVN